MCLKRQSRAVPARPKGCPERHLRGPSDAQSGSGDAGSGPRPATATLRAASARRKRRPEWLLRRPNDAQNALCVPPATPTAALGPNSEPQEPLRSLSCKLPAQISVAMSMFNGFGGPPRHVLALKNRQRIIPPLWDSRFSVAVRVVTHTRTDIWREWPTGLNNNIY